MAKKIQLLPKDLLEEIRVYLADSYLADYSAEIQDSVWQKVLSYGGRPERMEDRYSEFAEAIVDSEEK